MTGTTEQQHPRNLNPTCSVRTVVACVWFDISAFEMKMFSIDIAIFLPLALVGY